MKKLSLKLENCYGIKKLEGEFDFSSSNVFAIYAANGVMKTSFAKTFKDVAGGKQPHDQMDDSLMSICGMTLDSGMTIAPEQICVIEPYNEKVFDSEDKILTLLADDETRKEYLDIFKEIESAKKSSIASLKKISGSGNYESEIVESFAHLKAKNIFEIFGAILNDVKKSKDSFSFKYNEVFDKTRKVKKFLEENYPLLQRYIEKYTELINKSDFFAKDSDHVFGTAEAYNLGKSLEGDEYFTAGHKLVLKAHGDVSNKDSLSQIIADEIAKIFADGDLQKIFQDIDSALAANKELYAFKKVIEKDPTILIRLSNYDLFRQEVWFSFLKQIETGLESLVNLYNAKKDKLEAIMEKAENSRPLWEDAIKEFENRFIDTPFTIRIANKIDAILNQQTPAINFEFHGKVIDRRKLVDNVLSQGERRAFYLLNVIFEIKSRQLQGQETLFIIDDVADSFDYKNKYAIIEYLNDLAGEPIFNSIILTHNFDFYRTVTSRLGLPRDHKKHAIKSTGEIKLIEEVYQNPPFITWMNCLKCRSYGGRSFSQNDVTKHILALVPFVRNLIEYGKGLTINSTSYGSDYDALTSLLHAKANTKNITFRDLKLIYKEHLDKDDFDSGINVDNVVYDQIINAANTIAVNEFNLENKVILAIAIRHKAEEYMWSNVSNKSPISGNQTRELFERYKSNSDSDPKYVYVIKTLERVNIMTPENIHLNSFMYEPILDMGTDELKKLYDEVCNLV